MVRRLPPAVVTVLRNAYAVGRLLPCPLWPRALSENGRSFKLTIDTRLIPPIFCAEKANRSSLLKDRRVLKGFLATAGDRTA